MKILKYISLAIVATMLFTGCGEEFLEREQLFEISSNSYYSNPQEMNSALTSAYSQLIVDGGDNDPIFLANLLSDDCFGGGGPDNVDFQNTDGYRNTLESQYLNFWIAYYGGILRANLVIEKIDDVEYASITEKNQVRGEAYFLRAYFHFKLTQFFGKIIIRPSSDPVEASQATYDEIYNLIGSDLKQAIELMAATPFESIPVARNGHATKWAAEALMARVFLFYTGYHGKSEITLSDGTAITKGDVITWIDDCIANSGHKLVTDFRNLWPYAFTATDPLREAGEHEYPWAVNEGLIWEKDGNAETVFALKFSMYADWSREDGQNDNEYAGQIRYSNQLTLFMALRAQETATKSYPYGMGWGGCPVNPQLYESYEDADKRKMGSILNVMDPNESPIYENYVWGKWEFQQETGFSQKKYTPILANDTTFGPRGMYSVINGGPFSYQLECMQDEIIIRYADVLLMAAELKEDVSLLNLTRVRAGLDPLGSYSLAALQEERRHELAFEGLRIHDILRWGIAEQEFAKVQNVKIWNATIEDTYTASYRPETKGLLPIPEYEIAVANGRILQNPGW